MIDLLSILNSLPRRIGKLQQEQRIHAPRVQPIPIPWEIDAAWLISRAVVLEISALSCGLSLVMLSVKSVSFLPKRNRKRMMRSSERQDTSDLIYKAQINRGAKGTHFCGSFAPQLIPPIPIKSLGMNGGDDGARTRDLCRDRMDLVGIGTVLVVLLACYLLGVFR